MFGTTSHRQVLLAVALVALSLTGAVAGVTVAQTDASSDESAVSPSSIDTGVGLAAVNETEENLSATVVHEGERLELEPTDGQNVTVRTNATAGTKLTVVLRQNGNYADQYEVTVSEQGTATVSLDLRTLEPGTDVSLTVRHGQQTLTKASGVVSRPTVTFAEEGPLVLHAAPNQTVRVKSDASAGTETTVTLRSAEFNFLQSRQIAVSEDGTGVAAFDLSEVSPGTTFTATVSADAEAETEGIVVNESATVHRDATFTPASPDSNYTVRGQVMDSAVTELDVRVSPEGATHSGPRTVTVGENRTFAAAFGLSSLSADSAVAVEVGGIPRSVNSVVVTEEGRAPTVYAFVETPPNATIRYPQETVLVHPAANQTVYGETNLRPGTELTVKAVRDEPNSPDDFARTANVTVGDDGRFAADLNFTGIEPGTNFSVQVDRGLVTKDGRVVDESVALPTVTTTETETTTQAETETSTPDVPGFGVPVALVALLAGLALARRV